MKLHEISNNGSLTQAQIDWLASAITGTYEAVDGKINVEGNVKIPQTTILLPVQFGKVTGYFNCDHTQITSLEGSPSEVGGFFSCAETKITSLAGCATKVGSDFICIDTQITSLKGCPSEVGGYFSCTHTQITSLEGGPSKVGDHFYCCDTKMTSLIGVADNITQMDGEFWTDWDKIKSGGLGLVLIAGAKELSYVRLTDPFKIIEKYLGKPDLIFDCQQELIEAGFEEFAIL